MTKKRAEVPLNTQLERAERKVRKEGMAEILALLSAARGGFIPDYSPDCSCPDCDSGEVWQHRALVDAAMLNAASHNEVELVQIILEAGADVNTYNEKHRTALDCAVDEGNLKLVKALLIGGARLNPRDHYDEDHHYDNLSRDYLNYAPPLACAVRKGNVELVEILLAAGALRNGGKDGDEGWLINYAAEGDQVKITRAFIKAGAYLGPYEYDLWTPLMLAAANGKTTSAALLIKAATSMPRKKMA